MMTLEQASPWVSTSFSRACAPLRHFSLKCNIVFTYSIIFISITEKSLLQTLGTPYFILVLVSYPLFIFELLFMWFFFFQWFHCFHFLAETSYSSHFLLFRTIIWITEYYNQRGGKPLCMYIVVYSLSHDQLFCNPMDCSPPDFSVHGISQARILEWVAISSARGSSNPRMELMSLLPPALAGEFFTTYLFLWAALNWGNLCVAKSSQMWWLILGVNLTELRDAQIIGKALFLEVSVRMFLKD